MILCLDIGNSQIFGGVYENNHLKCYFRHNTTQNYTSDELGIFLKSVLRENEIDPAYIQQIAICSVVPHLDYSMNAACKKYFSLKPFFLQHDVRMNMKIKYPNPSEIGTDLLAEAIAAIELYPQQNIMIIDLGTATTFGIISAHAEFLGGIIIPGIRLSMESLQSNTAKLPLVKIVKPAKLLGDSTTECIQTGLYYGQLAAIKEITERATNEIFAGQQPMIIGTGGFSHMFAEENVFTQIIPSIILDGLLVALKMNTKT
jgi:type III pantothenate kinase